MALSYYPKFEYEASSFQEPQSELSMELQAFQNTSDYFNYSIEPLFDHHQPQQDLIFQEIDNFYTDPLIPCFSDGLFYPIPPPPLFPQFSSEFDVPLFDYGFPPAPAYFSPGRVETCYEVEEKKMSGGGGGGKTVSGQSIAARQRRKKIAERTQELGKLIPGGQKMNTAEMFQAAFHHVKFLQAQIAILQFMTTNIQSEEEEEEEAEHGEEEFQLLQSLVSSRMVQEKLSSARKYLVPQQFVQTLANDIEIQSNNPNISEQIHQLLLINYNNSSS